MTETNIPDDLNRRIVANFNALAETYDIPRFTQVCARRLVDLAALPPGAQVLDVATGTGWALWLRPSMSARPAECSEWIWPPSCWSVPGRRWSRRA